MDEAARAIPPAFPLTATVAVNPFLGQTGQDLATATALVARVGGTRLTLARSEYAAKRAAGEIENADLEAALLASTSPLKPASLDDLEVLIAQDSHRQAVPKSAELPIEQPKGLAVTIGTCRYEFFR